MEKLLAEDKNSQPHIFWRYNTSRENLELTNATNSTSKIKNSINLKKYDLILNMAKPILNLKRHPPSLLKLIPNYIYSSRGIPRSYIRLNQLPN